MGLKVVPASQEWNTPTFVMITWCDGVTEERAFATRNEAAAFLHSIPFMQYHYPDSEFIDIVAAKLRPAMVSIN